MLYFGILIALICVEYFIICYRHLNSTTRHNLFLFLVFIEISFFIGMRDVFTTPDTFTYLRYYYDVGNPSVESIFKSNDLELGYALINKIVYAVAGHHEVPILTVAGALSIGPILWTLRKRDYILLSVLIWCILNGLSTSLGNIRQSMALGWCLLGYYHLMNRKTAYVLMSLFIAVSFHFSAVCMFLVFPLYYLAGRLKLSLSHLLFMIFPITLVLVIFIKPLLSFLIQISGMYGAYLGMENSSIGAILYCILTAVVFTFAYSTYYYKHALFSATKRTNFKFLLLMSLFGFVMYTATIHGGSNRMSLYFTAVYIWIIPLSLSTLKKNKKLHTMFNICVAMGLAIILGSFVFFPSSFAVDNYVPFFVHRTYY